MMVAFLSALFLVLSIIGMSMPSQVSTTSDLFLKFDAVLPGYGKDYYNTDQPVIHDMALGWYVVASAQKDARRQAQRGADLLLAIMHKDGRRRPGWGLGFAWDAFSDGSVNSPGTVYGITNAIAVRALFDTYDLVGSEKYRDAALEALDYYRRVSYQKSSVGPDGGFFWYSDQQADIATNSVVMNVSAMLMGQYARAYSYTAHSEYKDIAERCARYLWAQRESVPEGVKWPYRFTDGIGPAHYNDAVHASYIVQGFLDYAKYLPPQFDISLAIDYLSNYSKTMTIGKQRLWGVGQIIFTLTEAGELEEADAVVADVLPRLKLSQHEFRFQTDQMESYARHTAHLLAGLARREAED